MFIVNMLAVLTILLLAFLCLKTRKKYPNHYLINPGFYFGLSWMITLIAYEIPILNYNPYPKEYFRILIYVNITTATWLLLLFVPMKPNKSSHILKTSPNQYITPQNYKILRFLAIIFAIICLSGSVIIFGKIITYGDIFQRRIFYLQRPSHEYLYFEWLYLAGQISAFLFGYLIKKMNKFFKYIIAGIPFFASILFSIATGRRQHMLFIIMAYLFGVFINQETQYIKTTKERIGYYIKSKRRIIIITCILITVFIRIFDYIHSAIPYYEEEYYLTELGQSTIFKSIFNIIPFGIWDYLVKPIYAYQSRVSIFRTLDRQYGRHSFWPVEYIAHKFMGLERKFTGGDLAIYFDEFQNSPATIFCGFTYDFGEDLVPAATILMVLISFGIFRFAIKKKKFSIFRSILLLHFCIFWAYSTQFSYFWGGGELLILWAFLAHISYNFMKKGRVKCSPMHA